MVDSTESTEKTTEYPHNDIKLRMEGVLEVKVDMSLSHISRSTLNSCKSALNSCKSALNSCKSALNSCKSVLNNWKSEDWWFFIKGPFIYVKHVLDLLKGSIPA